MIIRVIIRLTLAVAIAFGLCLLGYAPPQAMAPLAAAIGLGMGCESVMPYRRAIRIVTRG